MSAVIAPVIAEVGAPAHLQHHEGPQVGERHGVRLVEMGQLELWRLSDRAASQSRGGEARPAEEQRLVRAAKRRENRGQDDGGRVGDEAGRAAPRRRVEQGRSQKGTAS